MKRFYQNGGAVDEYPEWFDPRRSELLPSGAPNPYAHSGLLDLPIFPGGAGSLLAQTLGAAYIPKAIGELPESAQVPTQIGLLAAPFLPKAISGVASGVKWATQPKHIMKGAEKLSGYMMRHPESGVQKGLNELFGHLGKTKVFKEQMAETPLAGEMFSHFFTGKGKTLKYRFPENYQSKMVDRYVDAVDVSGTRANPPRTWRGERGTNKVGDTFTVPVDEGYLGTDVTSALGNFTVEGKIVKLPKKRTRIIRREGGEKYEQKKDFIEEPDYQSAIVKLRNYDTYNFKPEYKPAKTWDIQARIPEKIADKLPNFRLKPGAEEAMVGYGAESIHSPIVSSARSLIDFTKAYGGKGRPVTVNIRGLDAIFPRLGIGTPFSSYSKPYYYNLGTGKVGHTLKSVQ